MFLLLLFELHFSMGLLPLSLCDKVSKHNLTKGVSEKVETEEGMKKTDLIFAFFC